ncbi:MAG: hypothetical protein P4L67_03520 [Candidatus Pacebacteria bacterium]|nr:hypothetical protein [Candidatus Paceibacterota bacterium]
MAKFEIVWEAPEYEHREKGVSWYWITIIVAAFMIAFAVWQKDFLFGFFIVVAEILFIIWADRMPRDIPFMVTDEAVHIGQSRIHLIREFESWSTDRNDEDWADIHFYFRSRLRSPLKVIVPVDRVEEVRVDLKTVLKEVRHDMTLVDAIEKLFRF